MKAGKKGKEAVAEETNTFCRIVYITFYAKHKVTIEKKVDEMEAEALNQWFALETSKQQYLSILETIGN